MTSSDRSFYRGPGVARLEIRSWSDLEIAAGAGLLGETAWMELKAAIPASSKPANRELAKDLASLSVDGGLLIVGVDDQEQVVGFPGDPNSLVTRISQVATAAIHPPLFVDTQQLASPSQTDGVPLSHVVMVSVPASGSAPHMVDDQYWGRSSEGKRPLSDVEVERLMTSRRGRVESIGSELVEICQCRLKTGQM